MRRFSSSYCPVSASVSAHLDWEDAQAAREEEEEREYWNSGLAQEDKSLSGTPEGMELEPVERLERIEDDCIECWSV